MTRTLLPNDSEACGCVRPGVTCWYCIHGQHDRCTANHHGDTEATCPRLALQTSHGIVAILKKARRAQGLTQRALGHKLGLSQGRIHDIEGLRSDPSITAILRYAHAVGLRIELVPND